MLMRLLIHDKIVYEGDAIPVPRVGEVIRRGGDFLPVEAVTWDFVDRATVSVTLLIGDRPYRY
jgi:hypothetical protein